MIRTSRKLVYAVSGFLLFCLAAEIFLRRYYGFCDTVLMQADPNYEYIAQPNQQRFRFRRHIGYNSFSMRSPEPDSRNNIILGLGDSVLNGGVLTDQDSLASTLLSDELTLMNQNPVQFLNISAGSWGPDNCLAYLRHWGDFGAKKVYLIVSSHDAYDTMDFSPVVGVDKNFPERQYTLALWELTDRYLLPRIFPSGKEAVGTEIDKKANSSKFNTGFAGLFRYCHRNNLPLLIYLHAERSELETGFYNEQGQKIIRFALDHHIPLIRDLDNGLDPSHFRDQIHLNEKGQKLMASLILEQERG